MKLVTFKNKEGKIRSGWMSGGGIVDMQLADPRLPPDMLSFIDDHPGYFKLIEENGLDRSGASLPID